MEKITQKEVEIYRDVYYNHVKPLLKKGASSEEISDTILPILVLYGWTLEIYFNFQMIDLMQRMAYTTDIMKLQNKKINLSLRCDKENVDYSKSYQFPELRCPLRSEEKRNLN
jgi:hypothetical protein